MKAIITRYHGPTDHRGARISATTEGAGRVYEDYDHALDGEKLHFEAVKKLCKQLDWHGIFVAGGTPDERGYAWVFVEHASGYMPDQFKV